MAKKQARNKRFEEIDEHDQPTEPMAQVILTPFSSTTRVAGKRSGTTVPMPQQDERPFPWQGSNGVPPASASPVYPFLPPAPANRHNGRPPGGGVYPLHPGNGNGSLRAAPLQQHQSSIPLLVGIFFVLVQLVLLVRVVLLLTDQPGSAWWVSLIYGVSSVFVLPFHLLIDKVNIPLVSGTELYNYLVVLLAILLYGLVSRIVVRFLKALLNSR